MFTQSKFSHAAIYLGNSVYAEAVGLGVRQRSVKTILKDRIMVARLSETLVEGAPRVAAQAAESIAHYAGAGYWVKGAMLSVFKNARAEDRYRLFCSHLVAKMYLDAGVDLAPGTEAHKVTPEILAKSRLLRDVSKDTVYRAKLIPAHLADANFETLSDRESVILQSMHSDVATWFESQGIEAPQTWDYMVAFLVANVAGSLQQELDHEMGTAMVRLGYLKLPRQALEEVVMPFEKYVESIESSNFSKNEIILERAGLQAGLDAIDHQKEEHSKNVRFFSEEYQKNPLQSLELLIHQEKAFEAIADRMCELNKLALGRLWAKLSPAAQKDIWESVDKDLARMSENNVPIPRTWLEQLRTRVSSIGSAEKPD
jgi:hypothetical protein